MTILATHLPDHAGRWPFAVPSGLWHRLAVLKRYHRRLRARRHALGGALAEVSDPKLFADIGMAPPRRSGLEDWADAFIRHGRGAGGTS